MIVKISEKNDVAVDTETGEIEEGKSNISIVLIGERVLREKLIGEIRELIFNSNTEENIGDDIEE
jgi:hypothetical protein